MSDTKVIQDKVVEIIDQLQALAHPALQTVLAAIRIDAIASLIIGGVSLALAITLFLTMYKFMVKFVEESSDNEGNNGTVALLSSIGGLVFTIIAAVDLLSKYTWIAAFYPDVALALRLLSKVGI